MAPKQNSLTQPQCPVPDGHLLLLLRGGGRGEGRWGGWDGGGAYRYCKLSPSKIKPLFFNSAFLCLPPPPSSFCILCPYSWTVFVHQVPPASHDSLWVMLDPSGPLFSTSTHLADSLPDPSLQSFSSLHAHITLPDSGLHQFFHWLSQWPPDGSPCL